MALRVALCPPPWAAVVLSLVLVSVLVPPSTAIATANSQHPDLLPAECGLPQIVPWSLGELPATPVVGPGSTDRYGQHPWQARITRYDRRTGSYEHHCGGVIISAKYVLMAAHCVARNVARSELRVLVGDFRIDALEEDQVEFEVASLRVPPAYRAMSRPPHDIALLKLGRRDGAVIRFGRHVQPACLPSGDAEYEPKQLCDVSGWGGISTDGPLSVVLRSVKVSLVTDSYCTAHEAYGETFVPGAMVCAGLVPQGGADSCIGDSGGPLACPDRQSGRFVALGVVSWGDPLDCTRLPGVYTKVAQHVPWLLLQFRRYADDEALSRSQPRGAALTPAVGPLTPAVGPLTPAVGPLTPPVGPLTPPVGPLTPLVGPLMPPVGPLTPLPQECGRVRVRSQLPPAAEAGEVSDPATFPWLVAIYSNDTLRSEFVGSHETSVFITNGAIISDRWIIASIYWAWFTQIRDRTLQVVFGHQPPSGSSVGSIFSSSSNGMGAFVVGHKVIERSKEDVAVLVLLRTETKITFSDSVGPLCLVDPSYPSPMPQSEDLILVGSIGYRSKTLYTFNPISPVMWTKLSCVEQWRRQNERSARREITSRARRPCNIPILVQDTLNYLDGNQGDEVLAIADVPKSGVDLECRLTGNSRLAVSMPVVVDLVNAAGVDRWYAVGLAMAITDCTERHSLIVVLELRQFAGWIRSELDLYG